MAKTFATTTTCLKAEGKLRTYKPKEEVWFDDGREEKLLEYVKAKLDPESLNRSQDIIQLIDDFGVNENFMMNVGERKGSCVVDLIERHKPAIMMELGSYVGYSTVLFASVLKKIGGSSYISFEREPKFASVAAAMVDLAGLSDIVRFVVGPSSSSLVSEHAAGRLNSVDIVFFDHYKPSYVIDLKILESLNIIHEGTVLIADNVIDPGNPSYLSYVRSSPDQKSASINAASIDLNAFPSDSVHQYKKDYAPDKTELPGNPNILYESRLVLSQEPTGSPDGLEISICKSIA
ncbi:putative catechol O-methyltransferase 2 [Erysiphe necator]|uniref:catechol O-methyltransferase n=1 Tax=Uncinula necator TaxID=52586 RepID=A0A0B1PAW7_UNCNE|nr:putative catechol O-methyltransferase 2 [Erysiphe necator]KHJ34121.1 putative catechol o-methyltransferase [Erysiphe necator]